MTMKLLLMTMNSSFSGAWVGWGEEGEEKGGGQNSPCAKYCQQHAYSRCNMNHMQHTVGHMLRTENSAVKFDRV